MLRRVLWGLGCVAIGTATLLGRDDEALWLLARYRAAFPQDYEKWRRAQGLPPREP